MVAKMLAALRQLDALTLVSPLVDKYLKVVGVTRGRKPSIKIVDHIGSRWLGRCTWLSKHPDTSVIEIQKSILSHPVTLERVVAHEVCHHAFYMVMNEVDVQMMRQGLMSDHGEDFKQAAAKVNAAMGANFVTEKSDSEYTRDVKTKPFYMLIVPSYLGDKFGYIWGVRLTDKAKTQVRSIQERYKAKLLTSTEERWTNCASRLGSRHAGICVPKETEYQATLRKLYEAGENLTV